MRRIVTAGCVLAAALLPAACGETATSGAEAMAVAELPLKRGFYVSADTACASASSATLLLLRRDGINGARDSCDFLSIEQTGPQSYRVVERCEATEIVTWLIPDDSSFASRGESGRERNFRHCAQSGLPDPWRDNDISEVAGMMGE